MNLTLLNHRGAVAFICNLELDDQLFLAFKCTDPETYNCYHFVPRPTQNNSPDCPYNNRVAFT